MERARALAFLVLAVHVSICIVTSTVDRPSDAARQNFFHNISSRYKRLARQSVESNTLYVHAHSILLSCMNATMARAEALIQACNGRDLLSASKDLILRLRENRL